MKYRLKKDKIEYVFKVEDDVVFTHYFEGKFVRDAWVSIEEGREMWREAIFDGFIRCESSMLDSQGLKWTKTIQGLKIP